MDSYFKFTFKSSKGKQRRRATIVLRGIEAAVITAVAAALLWPELPSASGNHSSVPSCLVSPAPTPTL